MFVLGFNFSMGRQGSLLVISFPPQEFVITQEVGGGGGGGGCGGGKVVHSCPSLLRSRTLA